MKIIIDVPVKEMLSDHDEINIRITKDESGSYSIHMEGNDEEEVEAAMVESSDQPESQVLLSQFMGELIENFKSKGQIRLSEMYTSALKRFMLFCQNDNITMNDITQDLMLDYEAFMKRQGLAQNTSSFYLRILRATYNRAVRQGVVAQENPFELVYLGMGKTVKRAAPLEVLQKIWKVKLSDKSLAMARDIFLFSFYTRGMSFIDIANLKKTDIRGGYLVYKRQKTGQELKIAWRKAMQDIVDRYPAQDGIHLLDLLNATSETDIRRQYHAKQCSINNMLKRLSQELELNINLTMYVARHSWASIAKEMKVPISVISDSMGHTSEKTTQIYLKSIDAEEIDRNNDMLIDAISGIFDD